MTNSKLKLTPTKRSLPISLLRTRELIMEEVRPMLKRHNITEQQWRVLRVISEEGESAATTVADRACILAPSLTRIMRTLQEKGYIEIFKDQQDGRRVLVKLSITGEEFIREVTPESVELFHKLRALVGEERWESLVELLISIRDDINKGRSEQENK